MTENGFIRDMLDVKVLILYVLSMADIPLNIETIYELCFVDNRLTYFDVCEAVPELVDANMLKLCEEEKYELTKHGRDTLEITADSLAFTVRSEAKITVDRYLAEESRKKVVKTILLEEQNTWSVQTIWNDPETGTYELKLPVSGKEEGRNMAKVLQKHAKRLFNAIMDDIAEEMPENP